MSVEPILNVRGMRDLLKKAIVPKVAVSPIVAGDALQGPTAKMFIELGTQPTAYEVAKLYRGVIDRFVIDRADEAQARSIKDLGLRVWVTDTITHNETERARLAQEIIEWAER